MCIVIKIIRGQPLRKKQIEDRICLFCMLCLERKLLDS